MNYIVVRHSLSSLLLCAVIFFFGFAFVLKSEVHHWQLLKHRKIALDGKVTKNKFTRTNKVNIVSEVLRIASEQQVTIVQMPVVKNHRVNFMVKGSLSKLANFLSAINFLRMDNYFLTLNNGEEVQLEIKSLLSYDYLQNKSIAISAKNLGNLFVTPEGIKKYEFTENSLDPSLVNSISIKQLRVVGHVILNKITWVLFAFPDGATALVKAGSFVGLEHVQVVNESEMIVQGRKQPLLVG